MQKLEYSNFRFLLYNTRRSIHDVRRSSTGGSRCSVAKFLISVPLHKFRKLIPEQVNKQARLSSTSGKETHGPWFGASRGKHSSSLKFPRSNLSVVPSTYAERRSRHRPRLPNVFTLSVFSSLLRHPHLLPLLSTCVCMCVLVVSLHFLCLFRIFVAECHNFREKPSIWTQVGGGADDESASNEPIAENLSRALVKSATASSPIHPSSSLS